MLNFDQFKMFGWCLDATELIALLRLAPTIFSSHQLLKLILFHDWSPYSDVIFYQSIMVRNTRKELEMEVLRAVTEKGKEIGEGIVEELEVIRRMGDVEGENSQENIKDAMKALKGTVSEYLAKNCFWSKSNSNQQEHLAFL